MAIQTDFLNIIGLYNKIRKIYILKLTYMAKHQEHTKT